MPREPPNTSAALRGMAVSPLIIWFFMFDFVVMDCLVKNWARVFCARAAELLACFQAIGCETHHSFQVHDPGAASRRQLNPCHSHQNKIRGFFTLHPVIELSPVLTLPQSLDEPTEQ